MQTFFPRNIFVLLLILFSLFATACQPIQPVATAAGGTTAVDGMAIADSVVHLTILHLNDIYEITPVGGGTVGGLARVATLRDQLAAANPNTLVLFAGDLYTPSGLSSAIVDGTPLDGEQAVAVMNTVGVDYMTFGDHEFHVSSEDEFYQRLSATTFPLLSSNIRDGDGAAFPGVTDNTIFTVTNEAGQAVQVGIFGITEELGDTPVTHTYLDPMEAAAEQTTMLRDKVDILIALTHFHVPEDEALAQAYPNIDLILGGDDHEHMAVETGTDSAPIYKSDSNARNVYVVDLFYDTATAALTIEAHLQPITDELADDPETQAVIDTWQAVAFDAFREAGLAPDELVAQAPFDLDGFATSIRNHPTDLTNLIVAGMRNVATDTQAAFFYSGNLRLDDLIPAGGDILQYDLIRAFPTDFTVVAAEAPGQFLIDNFDYGFSAQGSGGYILTSDNVTAAADGSWLLDGEPIDPTATYKIAITDNLVDKGVVVQEEVGTLRSILTQQLQAASQ